MQLLPHLAFWNGCRSYVLGPGADVFAARSARETGDEEPPSKNHREEPAEMGDSKLLNSLAR